MNNSDDKYWVKVSKHEAEQYTNVGRAILANYERVRIDNFTIKLVRRNAGV
mgnify:CR=1 FL=1